MKGTIYKVTILTGVKYNGYKPFYVGQHNKILDNKYFGSGRMWLKFIYCLKKRYPTKWRKMLKLEILYESEKCTQKTLDVLEEYYIKKEKSHISYKLGGCNILWGTSNDFGSGSPMNNPDVVRRVTNKNRGKKGRKNSEEVKRVMSISAKKSWKNANERRKIVSERVSYYMQHGGAEKLSIERKGRKFSDETKRKISEHHADFSGRKHPLYGSTFMWITNGVKNKRFNGVELDIPQGWFKGYTQKIKKK